MLARAVRAVPDQLYWAELSWNGMARHPFAGGGQLGEVACYHRDQLGEDFATHLGDVPAELEPDHHGSHADQGSCRAGAPGRGRQFSPWALITGDAMSRGGALNRWKISLATAAGVSVALAGVASQAAVIPKPTMAGKLWLIKENDLATIGGNAADYDWVTCGITTDPVNIHVVGACLPGQVRTYTSYTRLQKDIADHKLVRGDTALLDQEPWSITPRWEIARPDKFLKQAGQLAARHDITLIEAPVGSLKSPQQFHEQLTAAKYAPIVALQDQGVAANIPKYIADTIAAARAIHRADSHVIVLAGIAPSSGMQVPMTAQQMFQEYQAVYSVVQGYWLNSNKWRGAPGCAPAGCPQLVQAFLALVNGRLVAGPRPSLRRVPVPSPGGSATSRLRAVA
jgi:hypothetical protein